MPYTANKTKLYLFSGNLLKDDNIEIPALTENDEIEFLMEVPELGGVPEKIDVTTLSYTSKKYIPGIKDYGDLVFKFLYDTDNYSNFKAMEDNETIATFVILYPDKTAHAFAAIPSVKIDAGAINGALTFSATMILRSDIATIDPVTQSTTPQA